MTVYYCCVYQTLHINLPSIIVEPSPPVEDPLTASGDAFVGIGAGAGAVAVTTNHLQTRNIIS